MKAHSFLVHVYRDNQYCYTINSIKRTMLSKYLREHGAKVDNNKLTNLDKSSIFTRDKFGFMYEIEEAEPKDDDRVVIIGNQEYISISEFCKRTNSKKKDLVKAFYNCNIQGITIGDSIFLYWRDLK